MCIARATPTRALHMYPTCALCVHPHTCIACAPNTCTLCMHPHMCIACAPPMCTLCMHPHAHIVHAPPCMHCTCNPHARIAHAPPCAHCMCRVKFFRCSNIKKSNSFYKIYSLLFFPVINRQNKHTAAQILWQSA